jgi:hypothetical protein
MTTDFDLDTFQSEVLKLVADLESAARYEK